MNATETEMLQRGYWAEDDAPLPNLERFFGEGK